MIDKEQKLSILDEILKSNSFINSKLNAKLLTYLVECEINGKTPSEYTIAVDVFGKDSSFNPNEDTLIRVSVYNLRKKLERYYQNMGKRTKFRVRIPKGRYEVIFYNNSKESISSILQNPQTVMGLIIVLLGIALIYLLSEKVLTKSELTDSSENQIFYSMYTDIVDSKNPKIIALGDDFIYFSNFSEFKADPIRYMIRNSAINSEAEFEEFKSQSKDRDELKKLPFSFFNQASIWPLPKVVILLNTLNQEYQLKSSSTINSNDLKNNDLIFLGSFWTLGILNQYLEKENISYNIIGEETLTINNNTDSSFTYKRNGVPAYEHDDYCLFLKILGPNKNSIYLLISFYATGTTGAVNYLTDPKELTNLQKTLTDLYGSVPDNYKILFKSKGFHREVLSTEVIFVEKI